MATLGIVLLLLTQSVRGAQCNGTVAEIPLGFHLQISHPTITLGLIYDQIVTTAAIYVTMWDGERLKIYWNSSLAWAVDYGIKG